MARSKGGLAKGLGAGIDVLIPANNESEESNAGIKEVDINKVEPDRNQPRQNFDEDELENLADSIKQYGVIDCRSQESTNYCKRIYRTGKSTYLSY